MNFDAIITFPKTSIVKTLAKADISSFDAIKLVGSEKTAIPRDGIQSLFNSLPDKEKTQIQFIQQTREPLDFEAYLYKLKHDADGKE